jgi:uncharacterized protein (DUF58 family)
MEGFIPQTDILNSRQFYIAARRLANSLSYGTDHSPLVGTGVEYLQSRPYQPGDPIRSIDWRVTARTRRFHVKEYEAAKRLPVYLLIDTSASMTIRSTSRGKYETAVFIAGGLAMACLDRISPVGVLGVGAVSLHVQPSLSKPQVMQWLHRLRRYDYHEATHLSKRLTELIPSLAQRTLLIVLSDLHDPEAVPLLKRVGQEHDCVVLQLRDPAERSARGAGILRAREAETARSFVTHGRAQWLDQEAVSQDLKRAAIDHLLIDVDQPYVHRLRHFFKARGVLGRGGR